MAACHGLGAALAHANAVSEAAHFNIEAAVRIFAYGNQFAVAAVHGKVHFALQLGINIQFHQQRRFQHFPRLRPFIGKSGKQAAQQLHAAERKVGCGAVRLFHQRAGVVSGGLVFVFQYARADGEAQLRIHAAAFHGGLGGFDGKDFFQPQPFSGNALRLRSFKQAAIQHFPQLGISAAILRNGGGEHHAAGVFKVVGIIFALKIAVITAAAPDIAGQGNFASVAGGVVAGGKAALPCAHHAACFLYSLNHIGIIRVKALVDLICRGIHHIIIPVARAVFALHGVGTRGNRLCLQGLQGPAVAHFIGHHAAEIILHGDGQHGPETAVFVPGDGQVALVEVGFFRFGDVKALFLRGRRLPGQGQAAAHGNGQAADRQVNCVAAVGEHNFRVRLKAPSCVVFYRVYALQRQRQVFRVGKGAQVNAQHAVVLNSARGRLRKGRHTHQQAERKNQRPEKYRLFHSHTSMVLCKRG